MFRNKGFLFMLLLILLSLSACTLDEHRPEPIKVQEKPMEEEVLPDPDPEEPEETPGESVEEPEVEIPLSEWMKKDLVQYMEKKYDGRSVASFGENIEGVYTSIETEKKIAVLTFDACGGVHGSGYDEDLITYLIDEGIPATLFINGRWIAENEEVMRMLAEEDLFEIENHGFTHKPLSVDGRSAYGIKGTESIEEVLDEIMKNQEAIATYTDRKPRYFRSGTAYYDDVTLEILSELDLKAVNYDVLGDAGATFNKEQMVRSARSVQEGSIFLYHMNQPDKAVSEGIKQVVPMLREMGYSFVKLSDYDDYLK